MSTHVLELVALSDQELKRAWPLPDLGKGDRVEIRVRRKAGEVHAVALFPGAVAFLRTALGDRLKDSRVAVPG